MTGPVPPPLPPAAVSATGNQASAESSLGPGQHRGSGQPTAATVISVTREGALIEAGGLRLLVTGGPPLPKGATLSLDLAGSQPGSGRLLAVAGRALEPPVMIHLQAAPPAPSASVPAKSAAPAPGVQLEARLLGPDGRPAGPPIPIRLTAIGGPMPAGGALIAELVGPGSTGRPLLTAAGLTLSLEAAIDVPAGTRLQLVLPEGFAARSGPAAAGEDALHRLIGILLQRPDQGELVGLRLPAADQGLAAGLLRWIAALRASDATPESEAGEPELRALREALGELGQQARAPLPGGWRMLVMPLGIEDPGALRLYLRDLPPEREGTPRRDRREAAKRAVLEVELSELGRCQLDLLCQARRFELAVRTERALAGALQDDIRGLLAAACELAGVAGRVEFRAAGLLRLPDPQAQAGHAWIA